MNDSYPIKQFLVDHPLPWRLSETGPTCVDAKNGAYVCEGAGASGGAFIVRACNEHEALLAQRDELLAVLTDFYCELLKTGGASNATIERVRNATGMTESPA